MYNLHMMYPNGMRVIPQYNVLNHFSKYCDGCQTTFDMLWETLDNIRIWAMHNLDLGKSHRIN